MYYSCENFIQKLYNFEICVNWLMIVFVYFISVIIPIFHCNWNIFNTSISFSAIENMCGKSESESFSFLNYIIAEKVQSMDFFCSFLPLNQKVWLSDYNVLNILVEWLITESIFNCVVRMEFHILVGFGMFRFIHFMITSSSALIA